MFSAPIGRQIKARRIALSLSQEALARMAGVSRTVLSGLESERGNPVQSDKLERLAAGLNAKLVVGLGDFQAEKAHARLEHRLGLAKLRERHLRLALDLCLRPQEAPAKIRRALEQVDLWEKRKSCSARDIESWREALSHAEPSEVASAMASFGEWEDAMFQNSPWSFLWN